MPTGSRQNMDRHRLADSRMLKKSLFSPTLPGAPRRAFHQAAFSPRKPPQCSALGEQAVLAAWGGRVRNATPPVLSSAAALLDRLFEHPAGNPLVPELQASTLCYAEMVSPQKGETGWSVSYTHLRAHETGRNLVCRLLLEKKKKK